MSSSNASLCSKIANLFHLTCPVFVATETLQSGVLLHFEQVCMLERVLCSHLEQFPAPKTWTEIAPRYFEAILFPFHHLCRRRMVKCSSHVEPGLFLAVIYIYPVLYTSSSCSPLCHQGKCFFFTSAVQMRRMGMTGTAPGRGGARKLNVAPSGAHGKSKAPTGHPVGLCASSVAEMGSIHPSPCLL